MTLQPLSSAKAPVTARPLTAGATAGQAEALPQDGFQRSQAEPAAARPQVSSSAAPAAALDPTKLGEKQFADSFGRVTHLALMLSSYVGGRARAQVLGAYKTLFTKMEPDTRFTIVCQDNRDKSDVLKAFKDSGAANPDRLQILQPNCGGLTVWARDMMVPLQLTESTDHVALLGQTPLHNWHDSDAKVPPAITAANPEILLDSNKGLVTDGGDTMSTNKDSFVGNYSMTATSERIAADAAKDPKYRAELVASFEARTGRKVVDEGGRIELPQHFDATGGHYQLIDNPGFAPKRLGPDQADMAEVCRSAAISLFEKTLGKPVTVMGADDPSTSHTEEPSTDHMDMGMTPVDDETCFVGDPGLAQSLVRSMSPEEKADAERILSERAGKPVSLDPGRNRDCQEDFDAYAKTLSGKGYNIDRMPHMEPGFSGSYISYNNCLMERFEKDGKQIRRVFLPQYDIPKLDSYATKVWEKHGFEVIPMPLGALSERWGALRCISNWLDRSPHG